MKSDESRDVLRARLDLPGPELVASLVEVHRRNVPDLEIHCAVWLNARKDPWGDGVDLLEIGIGIAFDLDPDFRATEFAPQRGWPRLRLRLANPREFETDKGKVYARLLLEMIKKGEAIVVFGDADPTSSVSLEPLLLAGSH